MARLARVLAAAILVLLLPRVASPQSGDALFDQNCSICHTIGGPTSADAPDLKDVTRRRDRAWIVSFVLDPEGVTRRGDAYAADLAKKYGSVMPPPEGLTRESVEAILTYIDQRSAGVHPATEAAAPAAAPTPTYTPEDVARGRDLYAGRVRLARTGPPCGSCHDIGAADLAGGTLAPVLSGVLDRLNGPKGLSLWLSAPPTPVMRAVYRAAPLGPDEVRALVAFVDSRRAEGAAAAAGVPRWFPALGVIVALGALVMIGVTWRGRFRAVRRPLMARPVHHAAPAASSAHHGFRSGGL